MSNEDDEDELPIPGLKHMDIVHPYPVEPHGVALEGLNALFAMGFTVPMALRMNSVYGKFGSSVQKPGTGTGTHMANVLIGAARVTKLAHLRDHEGGDDGERESNSHRDEPDLGAWQAQAYAYA